MPHAVLGRVAEAAAGPLVSTVGGIFGASKQAKAQQKALDAQERARQDALTYQRNKDSAMERRQKGAWSDYTRRLQGWATANPDAAKKLGYRLPGFKSEWLNAPVAGAPGAAPGMVPGAARGPVTLGGGRQVDANEYD